MPRAKNAVAARARRKKVLKQTKGNFGARKNVWTVKKKSEFRALWIQRINAAVRLEGLSYSKFMGLIHKADVDMNRKVLADLAMNHPEAFKAVVAKAKEFAK